MRATAAVWLAAGCTVALGARPAAPGSDLSTRALVARATAYVAQYQQQLTAVVADEEYTQEILAQTPLDTAMPRTRRVRAEIFFVFEPIDRQWMAIRDAILVDDRPVGDRPSARQAFETMSPSEVGRRFSQLNAYWNIGRIVRNFNEPTLGLLVFDARHVDRFKFDRRSVAHTPTGALATLEFRERGRSTLIRGLSSGAVFSRGEVVLEPEGRIRRTSFRAALDDVRVELTTEYTSHETLGMWLPSVFRERYERGREGDRQHERIACEARYTNYRRFDVTTRMKRQD